MWEIIAIILLILVSWVNISRFYIQKKIGRSLTKVEIGKPLRIPIDFSHYLRYFEIKGHNKGEIIVFEFHDKSINIGKDKRDTILYVEEVKEESRKEIK
jgi:hypothetical protein